MNYFKMFTWKNLDLIKEGIRTWGKCHIEETLNAEPLNM